MPTEISIEVRWKVIELWIYGDAPEKVASKTGISPGPCEILSWKSERVGTPNCSTFFRTLTSFGGCHGS